MTTAGLALFSRSALFRTTASKKYDDHVFLMDDYGAAALLTDDSSSDDGSQNRDDDAPTYHTKSFFDRLDDARFDRTFQAKDGSPEKCVSMERNVAEYTELDLNVVGLAEEEKDGNTATQSSLLKQGKRRILMSAQRMTEGSSKLKKE
jgi:hypothetical protein